MRGWIQFFYNHFALINQFIRDLILHTYTRPTQSPGRKKGKTTSQCRLNNVKEINYLTAVSFFCSHFSAQAFRWHLRVDRGLEEEKHNCFPFLNSVTIIYIPRFCMLICHKKQADMCKHFMLSNSSKYE